MIWVFLVINLMVLPVILFIVGLAAYHAGWADGVKDYKRTLGIR